MLDINSALSGRYKIKELVDKDGFCEIYHVDDLSFPGHPPRVLKHLYPHHHSGSESIERCKHFFENEAKSLSIVDTYEHFPRLYSYFEVNGEWFLVQEYFEGYNLAKELDLKIRWTEKQVIYFLQEILEILECIHQQNIINGDIKPKNIFRRKSDEKLLITNFFCSKFLLEDISLNKQTIIGTPGYMPPEAIMGNYGKYSDVYSVGMICLQSITGVHSSNISEESYDYEKLLSSRGFSSKVIDILIKMTDENYKTRYSDASEALKSILPLIYNTKETKANEFKIEKNIEFPPQYWEAGTSILSYFSRILSVKYPDRKIKVKIEQEELTLRMIIDTSDGEREEIEKTLDEYTMVVTGKLEPENFLSDPLEVIRLTNKLEIAHSEVRQSRQLLAYSEKYNSENQQRIESLEVQVNKLHCIIEQGLQSSNHAFGVIKKMTELEKSTYYLNQAKFGGGFATEGGFQVGGNFIDLSNSKNLTDTTQQIQDTLNELQNNGASEEEAIQKAASDLAKQADENSTVLGKLVKYGKFIADAASKTTVSEAVKGVISLALQMLNI